MPLDNANPLLLLLIAAISMGLAYYSGRAKAERLRELGRDLKDGRPRGFAVLVVVFAIILMSQVFSG